jgi:hypothetical protein
MKRQYWILLVLVCSVVSFFVGRYSVGVPIVTAAIYSILLVIVGGFVTQLSGIVSLIRDWRKDMLAEKKVPGLIFNRFFTNKTKTIFVARITKKKGEGKVMSCEGVLTVNGTDIGNTSTVWLDGAKRRCDVGGDAFLVLFEAKESRYKEGEVTKQLLFFRATATDGKPISILEQYTEFADKILLVKLQADSGAELPEPSKSKIGSIMKKAEIDNSLDTLGFDELISSGQAPS